MLCWLNNWTNEHVYNLHTSLRRSLRFNSPTTYLGISVLETLCTDLCSKRSNVQSILERKCFLFFLLVSMNQVGREAAKTAGNGVELNWSWKRKFYFFPESLSKHLLSTLFDDTVGTAVEIVWAKKSDVASLEGKSLIQKPKVNFPPSWCSTLTSTYCCRFFFSQAQTLMLQTKTVLDRFQDKRER